MYAARLWSVRHAAGLERLYDLFAVAMVRLHPLFERIGYARIEKPVAAIESRLKGFMFDCQMCGRCVLSSTGMSCPMNCPKGLRNGPCGGVREDGNCEVKPEMPCVWVEAWCGAQRMRAGAAIGDPQIPLDHGLAGSSSWLRMVRELAAERASDGKTG
ncbi:MAG: methylenetetrahydrofolate reductase C-terminal domain-containing protein [Alphaproteobacteria bacterium]